MQIQGLHWQERVGWGEERWGVLGEGERGLLWEEDEEEKEEEEKEEEEKNEEEQEEQGTVQRVQHGREARRRNHPDFAWPAN
ncbi:unnamed protein product [Closterium sp. NIES-65]|nr:unnamed protein product [Closterium sp. NIES-65]